MTFCDLQNLTILVNSLTKFVTWIWTPIRQRIWPLTTYTGWLVLPLACVIGSMPTQAAATILVFDRITSVDQPVFLKVQTRGKFFAEGGQRVTLTLDGQKTFNLLTGGDGFGYVKYTPRTAGRYRIGIPGDSSVAEAFLLVVSPDESIVLLEIEMLLKSGLQTPDENQSAREVLGKLAQTYHLVYVTRVVGAPAAKRLLVSMKFPAGLALQGQMPDVVRALSDSKVPIRAVIASAGLLTGPVNAIPTRLTFDQTENGTTVEDWYQIETILTGSEP